jgi:RNA polymerase sigma-70 factor, ECF subfamily
VDITATAERPAGSADEQLIERARRGDAAAFDGLVRGRIDRCYRLAWSILLNDADAADATQDAFVSAWRQLPRLRDPHAFDAWLNRIVANSARMSRRHRVRLREVQVRSVTDAAPSSEPPADHEQPNEIDRVADVDAIGRAFDRLRGHERAILALHYVDGRPVAEIANTLRVPVGTAKSRLHTARRALEQAMEAEA